MTKQVKCPLFGHWMHVVRNVWCVPALHISVGHFSGFRAVWPVSPKFSFFNSTIHLHKTWFFRCLLDNKYNKYWCHICYMCCDSKFWPCCKCHFFCRGSRGLVSILRLGGPILLRNFEIFEKICTYLVNPKILGGPWPPWHYALKCTSNPSEI